MSDSNDERRSDRQPQFETRLESARRLRLVITAGSFLLGTVLILNGQTLIGVLLAGFAIFRLVLVSGRGRGRQHLRNDVSVQAGQWLRGHARDEFLVAASVIGIPAGELRDEFEQGRSIAEVAAARSTDLGGVIHAIAEDLAARLHQAVAEGSVAEHDAHDIETITSRWATRLVHGHRGDFRQPGHA